MSYILYAHPELGGEKDWWKVGKSITPYSSVRMRQRLMVKQFKIPYLWFGHPADITNLEAKLIERFPHPGVYRGNQELINVKGTRLETYINGYIKRNKLCIVQLALQEPYTAYNSKLCPFGFPSENKIDSWAQDRLDELFGQSTIRQRNKIPKTLKPRNRFSSLFDVDE